MIDLSQCRSVKNSPILYIVQQSKLVDMSRLLGVSRRDKVLGRGGGGGGEYLDGYWCCGGNRSLKFYCVNMCRLGN